MKKKRLYKEDAVQEDLFHFEMGNELGAHIQQELVKQEQTNKQCDKIVQDRKSVV